jgi:hypothetical protein
MLMQIEQTPDSNLESDLTSTGFCSPNSTVAEWYPSVAAAILST